MTISKAQDLLSKCDSDAKYKIVLKAIEIATKIPEDNLNELVVNYESTYLSAIEDLKIALEKSCETC